MRFFNTTLIAVLMVFLGVQYTFSQIIAPTGISTRASSQLVYYYDQANSGDTVIQLVNTHPTAGTWVHVQIFRSFDPDQDPTTPPVICDERNFVDFLTPTDTHVYDLGFNNFIKNDGQSTSIDVGDSEETKGFVVITPVVSEADLTATSFQFLTGSSKDISERFVVNAIGRDAVSFTTGEVEPIGTPLDGESNGYVVLQPEELLFDFAGDEAAVDVVGIAFADSYGPAGLLGYAVTPADVTWTSFIFDFKEDPTSCGNRAVSCFTTAGLNDNNLQANVELSVVGGDLLCSGAETPRYDEGGNTTANFNQQFGVFGWTRIFVSGLEDFENHIGYFISPQFPQGADLMYVRGERTEIDPEPIPEDCAVEGDEDEDGFADCLDTDCATAENCETGAEECADTMDNDGDGQTDCADLGCDGFAGCEFGEEVSCDDGIDNDADGAVDGDDTDCQDADTGGGGGGGGGCTVATAVTASTAAANFLLPLLPLAGAYGYRRLRRRNSK